MHLRCGALLVSSSYSAVSALVVGVSKRAAPLSRCLKQQRGASSRMMMSAAAAPYTLYDIPVSNNGARIRMILYYKEVSAEEVAVVSPIKAFGGLTGEYLKVNPQAKMPALDCRDEDTTIPESDTIARFLGAKFNAGSSVGDFAPAAGTELALKADRIARHHDIYLASVQTALYRAPTSGFIQHGTREDAIKYFEKQLVILEGYLDEEGPYMLGAQPTHADVACFPTVIFAHKMLPKFKGHDFTMGPKLTKWWEYMTSGEDPVAARIFEEVGGALDGWASKGRWDTIRGAGLRDEAERTLFDKIVDKSIPSTVVYEDERVVAFEDINPAAPKHVVLIPKDRDGLTQLRFATEEHTFILGYLMAKVPAVAEAAGLEDYRLVVNDGAEAGQTVFHLHIHLIGGRKLTWPPG